MLSKLLPPPQVTGKEETTGLCQQLSKLNLEKWKSCIKYGVTLLPLFNTFIEYSLCYQYPIILEVGDEMVNETLHDWPF